MPNSKYQDDLIDAHVSKINFAVQATAGSGKSHTSRLLAAARPNDKHLMMMFSDTLYQEALIKNAGMGNVATAKIYATGAQAMNQRHPSVQFADMSSEESRFKYLRWFHAHSLLKRVRNDKQRESAAWLLSRCFDMLRLTLTEMDDMESVSDTLADYDLDLPKGFVIDECLPLFIGAAEYGRNQIVQGVRDFTDMVWIPSVEDYKLRLECDVLIIDERQDLSAAQDGLIQRVNSVEQRHFGDRYQSIFGFGGASSAAMDTAIAQCDGRVMPLSISYRCPDGVVARAKLISPEMEHWDEHPANGPDCVQEIMEGEMRPHLQAGDVILSRRKAPMVRLCLELLKEGYNVTIKGDDVAKKMRGDVMELRVMNNWNDSTASFHSLLSRFKGDKARGILSRPFTNTERALQQLDDRVNCLQYFFEQLRPPTFGDFILQLATAFDRKGANILMMTIHKAKGLEWDRVLLLEHSKLPLTWNGQSDEQYTQEQNVLFVGLTRAKQKLFLVEPEMEDR